MMLPNFITKRYFKNYLRVFSNIERNAYSSEEKKAIIDKFIELSKFIFSKDNLKYDINGKRIGLSKGSPLIGETALLKRIEKYGYQEINSITTAIPGSKCHSLLKILPSLGNRPAYCEITFTWEHTPSSLTDTATSLFTELSQMVEVEYGYAYLASSNTSIVGEWKTNLFGISYRPKLEQLWEKKIHLIKEGAIKKIYPINCFNKKQKERLNLKCATTSSIGNGYLQICIVN